MLILPLIFGLIGIGETSSYYNDTETSNENSFTANSLDFSLSKYSFENTIVPGETVLKNATIINDGGIDFQYILKTEEVADENNFCEMLNLQAKLNETEQYNGDLMLLNTSALITLGNWEFNIKLPTNENSFINGEECRFDIVFKGWQTNINAYENGGFNDEERISFTITADTGKGVVLNEFLPRPNGTAYGFDFGSDSSDMPQGEWIELYNNSAEAVDMTGWYTRDATNGAGNKVIITVLNTFPATTIISGKSWLVVYMNKPILNNNGDTVRLFTDTDVLVDSYSYNNHDFCEIELTPGNENSTDTSGEDCVDVPPNKSYARIPDGIGEWVDPIPTPGDANVVDIPIVTFTDLNNIVAEEELIIEEPKIIAEEIAVAELQPEVGQHLTEEESPQERVASIEPQA